MAKGTRTLKCTAALLALFTMASSDETDMTKVPDWNYVQTGTTSCEKGNPCGPDYWKAKYPNCSNMDEGSPFDLKSDEHVYQSLDLKVFKTDACNDVEFMLNQHTTQVETDKTCPKAFSVFKGESFNFVQFHFHSPSEHTVDGKRFPLEMHYVHARADGRFLVLALFIGVDSSAKFSEFIETVHRNVPTGGEDEGFNFHDAVKKITGFSPYKAFISSAIEKGFLHYVGSATTPPCQLPTDWILFEEPFYITPSVLDAYRSIINNDPHNQLASYGNILGDDTITPIFHEKAGDLNWDSDLKCNFRPPQRIASRTIYTTKPSSSPKTNPPDYRTWGIVAVVVLAVLGAGVCGYKYIKSQKSSTEARSQAVQGYSKLLVT